MDIFASDKAILSCFKKYAVFKGRSSRSEFWFFFLFYFVISTIFPLIPFLGVIGGILSLVCLCPYLAVCVRRLHDTGKSGKWIFLPLIGLVFFIPAIISAVSAGDIEDIFSSSLVWIIIGGLFSLVTEIILIVFYAKPSQAGENKYGPEPLKTGDDEAKKTDAEELQKLKKLLDDGVITQEDYDKKKRELLGL